MRKRDKRAELPNPVGLVALVTIVFLIAFGFVLYDGRESVENVRKLEETVTKLEGSVTKLEANVDYLTDSVIKLEENVSNLADRVTKLEEDSQLTYAMALKNTETLANLCTHFATGCTTVYKKGAH